MYIWKFNQSNQLEAGVPAEFQAHQGKVSGNKTVQLYDRGRTRGHNNSLKSMSGWASQITVTIHLVKDHTNDVEG